MIDPDRPVEVARTESPRGEVVLRRRSETGRGVWELRVNGVFVMDTEEVSTEVALAGSALARVAAPRAVLIGGLGLGFTLRAVLDDPRVEQVTVVEIERGLIAWMRTGTVPHGPAVLADARVTVMEADLAQAPQELQGREFDLVLLDIDNGPDNLVYTENARVYAEDFLTRISGILSPGGIVAIWSSADSADLRDRLHRVFGNAESTGIDVDLQGRAERYWLLSASRTAP